MIHGQDNTVHSCDSDWDDWPQRKPCRLKSKWKLNALITVLNTHPFWSCIQALVWCGAFPWMIIMLSHFKFLPIRSHWQHDSTSNYQMFSTILYFQHVLYNKYSVKPSLKCSHSKRDSLPAFILALWLKNEEGGGVLCDVLLMITSDTQPLVDGKQDGKTKLSSCYPLLSCKIQWTLHTWETLKNKIKQNVTIFQHEFLEIWISEIWAAQNTGQWVHKPLGVRRKQDRTLSLVWPFSH